MMIGPSAASTAKSVFLPALPFDKWESAKETLHRYAQVLGKVRLGCCAPGYLPAGRSPQDISHLRDVRPQILSSASRIGVSPPRISKVLW
jgi:hypothetical protein